MAKVQARPYGFFYRIEIPQLMSLIQAPCWDRRLASSFTATTASQSSTEHGAIPQRAAAEGSVGFVERVKREFAELNGVNIGKVIVNFQIIG